MPVDKQVLEQCIAEAADGDAEMATFLRTRYAANDALAAKFVGGYMRSSDYTKKTQEIADERKQFAGSADQLKTLRAALTAAETEKNTILKDLAGHRVSTAKARELMKILQDKYQLTDEDLPGMSDLIETSKKGKPVDNTDDLDARFAALKSDILKEAETRFAGAMIPELGAMATLPIIWQDINREHLELTGKPLTFAEQQEIFKVAKEGKSGGLRDVWEQKYNIGGDAGLRMQKRDERLKVDWSAEREKAEADRASKAALERVAPQQIDLGTGRNISAAFQTKFKQFEMDPSKPAVADPGGVPSLAVAPGQHVRQTGNRGPSGAERAAAKFLQGAQNRKTA